VNLVVRPADLEADGQYLVAAMRRYLTPLSDDRRFNWLYKDNPHGKAKAWVIIDRDTDGIVGSAAAFPRRIYSEGNELLGWILGDFWISDDYRSLGPALQLQRACLTVIDSGVGEFCYDFPSQRMMSVYKRLRIEPFHEMVRLAKPLRVDRFVSKYVNSPTAKAVIGGAGNLALRLSVAKSGNATLRVGLHEGNCGVEFSSLAREVGATQLCTQRSAEYLNWRYLRHPSDRYEILTVHEKERLLAYAVFSRQGEDAVLVDLFGVTVCDAIETILYHLSGLLREGGVETISAAVLEIHPLVSWLSAAGFKRREACPVVVYHAARTNGLLSKRNWFLMQGDRDS
jgi:hypothetical protein